MKVRLSNAQVHIDKDKNDWYDEYIRKDVVMIKVNGKEIEITKFPNGETLVNTEYLNSLDPKRKVKVEFKWFNDEDLLHLYFVLNHIDSRIDSDRYLYVYYMPYSRMDRDQNGNCFTLKYVTSMFSGAMFFGFRVFVVEPHSDVTLALLGAERINVITPLMNKVLSERQIDVICYPDKGARDRFNDDEVTLPVAYCNKKRDFDTGKILGLELVTPVDLNGKNVLILDDLCSKGGTFFYTAKELKRAGADDVCLGVCHMEPTVKYGEIIKEDSDISHIYCTNSMLHNTDILLASPKLTVYDLGHFISKKELIEIAKESSKKGE